jgi:transcriptional regulator with GAF, ATPase, and Fis domain
MNGQYLETLGEGETPGQTAGEADGREGPQQVPSRAAASPETRDRSLCLKSLISDFERDVIGYVLKETGWNQRRAARILGVKYTTLNHKVIKLGLLKPRDGREASGRDGRAGLGIPARGAEGPRQP